MFRNAKKNFNLPSLFARALILSFITGLTLFVYWDVQNHQFLNFDDNMYVSSNIHVKNGFSLENIRWAFTFTDVSYWQPLPLLTHMLDSQLFGLKPGPHLLVNLAMHILNSLLLFLIMAKLTGAPIKAALVALLFAVHPLNVESVAWLAERKTVLSTLFFFAALYGYIHYTQQKRKWIYAVILCLYTLGLMTKPPILTFPVLLLLLDYWPLKRFGKLAADPSDRTDVSTTPANRSISFWRSDTGMIILEKAPFFVLSALSLMITMASVIHQHMVVNQQLVPIYLRVYNLFISIIQYLRYCHVNLVMS